MRAIDMHIHVPRQPGLPPIEIEEQLLRYFRAPPPPKDGAEMAEKYRELDLFGVIFSVDTRTNTGEAPDSNDYVAGIVRQHPEQFMGFASVDPWLGKAAVLELERSVTELELRGLKLHPVHQAFFPNDPRFYPLYAAADGLGVPVLFHSGYAGAGSGLPGGAGLKLKYSAPIPGIDDVAADFPNLTIIMAHPAWPWVEEQIAVALHKANVYLDLSGWSPRFIPEALVREANTRLQDKVMFGSDYPFLQPDRWLQDFQNLKMRDPVVEKVLLTNAQRVLKLV
jgi:predicted TIM-barrel fold metal-dependent hydrolase